MEWSTGPGLERDLLYAGTVSVLVPADCAQPEDGFVAVPSRASAGGFVFVDVDGADLSPVGPGSVSWDIHRDRAYRVMRTGSRNGKAREGSGIDEAYFPGIDVLAVYMAAASDPDPEGLLAWAMGRGLVRSPGHAVAQVPEELLLSGLDGTGVVFPDPEAMGGIGFIGGPGVAFVAGSLDLGSWCGTVWRLSGRSLVPVSVTSALQAVRSAMAVWSGADAGKRNRFLFMKPERMPVFPGFHGRETVLRDVNPRWVSKTDLPGTVQVAVPDRSGGFLFVLVDELAVLPSGESVSVYLGRSDMPVTCRLPSGEPVIRMADRLARDFQVRDGPGKPSEGVRICGISRADVDTDYTECVSDVSFVGPDGTPCGFLVRMEDLKEGDDGLLAVTLGEPDSLVRFYRRAGDGMREGVPLTASGLAVLIDRTAAAARQERTCVYDA